MILSVITYKSFERQIRSNSNEIFKERVVLFLFISRVNNNHNIELSFNVVYILHKYKQVM